MKPLLRYVDKLTASPSKLTQADADAVFSSSGDSPARGERLTRGRPTARNGRLRRSPRRRPQASSR